MLRLLGVLAMLAVTVPSLSAQDKGKAPVRDGFGASFGLGIGSDGVSCDGCDEERTNALSGFLKLGRHIKPTLFLGFEANIWTDTETDPFGDGDFVETLGFYNAVAQWYPKASSNAYLQAGLGMARYSGADDVDEITVTAPAVSFGLGYDLRLTRGFSLTPYVNMLTSTEADVKFNGENAGFKASVNLVQFGMALTWH